MKKKAPTETYESWEDEPAFLTKMQRADPVGHLRSIAKSAPLHQMRFRLQDMFTAAMYSPHWKDDSPKQKGDRVWFFDELMDLLELANLIDQMARNGKITYSYSLNVK